MSQKYAYEDEVITDKSSTEDTARYYDSWSKKYDADMVTGRFNGPYLVAEAFVELGLDKNLEILDLLAGTGKVAQLIAPHGYTNIDAIDGSSEMLARSKERGLYKNYIHAILGRGHKAPVEDEAYDVIINCGGFAPGHLYSDVFPELIRMVRKGGLICWSMRQGYELTSEGYVSFESDVEKLVEGGSWEHFKPRKSVKEYFLGSDGWVYFMKKR